MKYIDAEKLKYEIERLEMAWKAIADNAANSNMRNFYDGGVEICKELLGKVDSLQQELPITECNELESEYKRFSLSDHHQLQISLGNAGIDIARHFYELGINTRKEK